jgi:hypothetical protein
VCVSESGGIVYAAYSIENWVEKRVRNPRKGREEGL